MKAIFISILLFVTSISAIAQINDYPPIVGADSTYFENEFKQLKFNSTDSNIWQIGVPNKVFFDSAYSRNNALLTDTTRPYPTNNHSFFDLIIPLKFSNIQVEFWHKFDTDTLKDGGFIEVSFDKGNTWKNLVNKDSVYHDRNCYNNLYTEKNFLSDKINGISGNSMTWKLAMIHFEIFILAKKEFIDTLMLRFNFISDSIQSNKSGWMIDNLVVWRIKPVGAVNEVSARKSFFQVFPNPMDEWTSIVIHSSLNTNNVLMITNLLGETIKEIKEFHNNETKISKEDISTGVYFIKLITDGNIVETQKLIVK
jgi:hypothetical protein